MIERLEWLGIGYWVSRCFAKSGIFAPLRLLKGIGYLLKIPFLSGDT